jgi:rod shape determining protein RodA
VPPLLLIYLQPDLGTTIIIAVVWFVMVLMAGVHLFHVGLLGLLAVLVSPLIWFTLADYQRDRVLLFLDPTSDPGAYYNVEQALISIGSGGVVG